MADFEVEETQRTRYSLKGFSKEYDLEAGDKLADDATLVAIAGKTVPNGYRVKVDVNITIIEVEKL